MKMFIFFAIVFLSAGSAKDSKIRDFVSAYEKAFNGKAKNIEEAFSTNYIKRFKGGKTSLEKMLENSKIEGRFSVAESFVKEDLVYLKLKTTSKDGKIQTAKNFMILTEENGRLKLEGMADHLTGDQESSID